MSIRTTAEMRQLARNRLIESRLTPNAISVTGLVGNLIAAVPSMHVAFALMIAVPAIMLVKRRAFKVLWAIYPFVVTFVVMVTANHFWLDAALGALVAAFSAYAAYAAFARARPDDWAWRTAHA